jgi:hypothetical protein
LGIAIHPCGAVIDMRKSVGGGFIKGCGDGVSDRRNIIKGAFYTVLTSGGHHLPGQVGICPEVFNEDILSDVRQSKKEIFQLSLPFF